MSAKKHQLRLLITDNYTRNAAKHISKGDLKNYSTDNIYIYKEITDEEYKEAIRTGKNEPFMMDELGKEAEYNFNFKN